MSSKAAYTEFESWWKENVSNFVPKKKKFGQWLTKRFEKKKSGTVFYHGVGLLADLEEQENENRMLRDHVNPPKK